MTGTVEGLIFLALLLILYAVITKGDSNGN